MSASPVLGEWHEEGFGNPVVQDIKSSEFEYRVNEVVQGAKYRTIEDVKDAVKLWAVSLRKEFRVLKSSSKEYEVRFGSKIRQGFAGGITSLTLHLPSLDLVGIK